MMEDTWLCVDESVSSDEDFPDSDGIDSETEAELYSIIHFEENLSGVSCRTSVTKNVNVTEAPILTSDKIKCIVLNTEKNGTNEEPEFVGNTAKSFFQNDNESARKESSSETLFLNKLAKYLSPKKEKISDLDHKVPNGFRVNNSNDTNSPQSTSLNNEKKRKFDHSSPNCSNSPKKNCRAVVDSSDSDCDIWTEADLSDKKDIQINVCKDEDTIYISSDSEPDLAQPSKSRISNLRNLSMPNIKIGQNSKDLWFINPEDTNRPKNNKARRYHDNCEVTCSNCNSKGHPPRACPLPKSIKCYICGGGHMGTVCTNRICGKCYGTGHDSRRCRKPYVSYCDLCHFKGHVKENCPDLWRRYHLTTKPGKIVRGTHVIPKSYPYCCNCGQPGHFGAVCDQEFRGYKNSFPTWPCVLSYDEPPRNFQRRRLNEFKNECIRREKKAPCRIRQNKPNEGGNVAKKEKKKKKNKVKLLSASNIKQVIKEKNFPRTPKNNSSVSDPSSGALPASVQMLKSADEKRKQKNRIKRMRRRQNRARGKEQRSQGNV